jgi:hypothetical protein
MIFYTPDPAVFDEGELYVVQGMADLPPLPEGRVAIGQGYNLVASPNITQAIPGSISFQYMGVDALKEGIVEEQEVLLTVYHWDGRQWRALPSVCDPESNLVSAPIQGDGVYVLLDRAQFSIYLPLALRER